MLSLLTAFFLYHGDASLGWWILFGFAFFWQTIMHILVMIIAALK